ncbi:MULTISPECIES: restriction endonuclease subunit S [Halomonadaceae]|uniref:Restriction endonuclease subunit S n=2 Tax=Vreelandella TaxID=3137766 RepID=A0A7Z0RXC0_9GAMM|nr:MULTISPECIES: restriction endonuclease subunit S [Halomonas]NYS77040.1 restriction endonuclease subunit S [Halomonas glaciei]|tara:strand:- start:8520 stop:9866 length:1347 start_codon:yes stop_codon:yes gene_type:complete
MSDLATIPLGNLASLRRGITYTESALRDNPEDGIPYVNMKSFLKNGGFNNNGLKYYSGFFTDQDLVGKSDILIANTDVTREGDIIGVPALFLGNVNSNQILYSHHVTRLRLDGAQSVSYLFYLFCTDRYRREMKKYARGTTVLMLDMKGLQRIPVTYHVNIAQQDKIARILQTIDQAIEKTDTLIDKYQQIKAGLMHDLFTRGIGSDGKLRPPREQAPELYKETPIGWIPKEWKISAISSVLESVVDGPFGSNLKTEHYVEDPGVRVVRLQNVLKYEYNDSDRAYVSDRHAGKLVRNKVIGEDVLIAGLGDDKFPVGRSCMYPNGLPSAINKADCFRARCVSSIAMNKFFMLFLNSMLARGQVRRYEQGVTRPRINTGNLKQLNIALPSIKEQAAICSKFNRIQDLVEVEKRRLAKLQKQKSGLMHDLLTGKVPVQVEPEAKPEPVNA